MTSMADGIEQPLPLDKARIEVEQDGRKRSVSALHIGWAVNRTFARYYSPPVITFPSQSKPSLIMDQYVWLDRMNILEKDLVFLLKLPHNRFWSQVVYHEDIHEAFNSYLLNAPRPHDVNVRHFTEEMRLKQNDIHHLMFLVYLRMATYKESKTCHITPSVFGTLIYDYFIFDIPKIMDLCTLFSTNNRTFLQKMITNVFTTQPKYMDDLRNAICEIDKVYSSILERFGLTSSECAVDLNGACCKLTQPRARSLELPLTQFLDVYFYFIDACCTLFSFLDVYPTVCGEFLVLKFPAKIAAFYSTIIPFLLKELDGRRQCGEMPSCFEDILNLLGMARKSLIKTFRQIIEYCCFKPILEKDCVFNNGPSVDDYFDIMTGMLSEKCFMVDYERHFPFNEDVDMFIQTGLFLDHNRISYITDGLNMLLNECCDGQSNAEVSTAIVNNEDTQAHQTSEGTPHSSSNGETAASAISINHHTACADPAVSNDTLNSLVIQVKELLPEHETTFIKECLVHYNFKAERVINAILENSLPPHLQNAGNQREKEMEKARTVDRRANVYDNDEFDVFANDNIDLSRIHEGKWSQKRNDVGESKKNENLKQVTLMLSAKYETAERENREDLYEDEYDDTYDEQMIAVNESVTWDELLDRRPFVIPNVLRNFTSQEKNGGDEEETPTEEETIQEHTLPIKDEFVTNPAIERERAAQHRRNVYQQQDVKGRPKGQGQDIQVTRNRDNKERHKTFHGNHNRRAMADRKRSRGMLPS